MELAERITGRVTELTGEAELLRKQLADAEHELERLVIAGQVITQPVTRPPPASRAPPGRRSGVSGCWCPLAARHPARATCQLTTGRWSRRSPQQRPRPAGR
jgi:hypothetical protein